MWPISWAMTAWSCGRVIASSRPSVRAIDRQSYRLYLTKFEESRISDAMDTEKIANVKLIEPAQLPLKPVSPRIRLNMVLAVFLGGFGAPQDLLRT